MKTAKRLPPPPPTWHAWVRLDDEAQWHILASATSERAAMTAVHLLKLQGDVMVLQTGQDPNRESSHAHPQGRGDDGGRARHEAFAVRAGRGKRFGGNGS